MLQLLYACKCLLRVGGWGHVIELSKAFRSRIVSELPTSVLTGCQGREKLLD